MNDNLPEKQINIDERLALLELNRSAVRILITKIAAWFLFAGSGIFIIVLLVAHFLRCDASSNIFIDSAKNLFTTILPIASGIIAFWFAGRNTGGENKEAKK